MTRPYAILKVSRVAYDKGLRVRFGANGDKAIYAINDSRTIIVKYAPDASGEYAEVPEAKGTEAPATLRKIATPEPEVQEGLE